MFKVYMSNLFIILLFNIFNVNVKNSNEKVDSIILLLVGYLNTAYDFKLDNNNLMPNSISVNNKMYVDKNCNNDSTIFYPTILSLSTLDSINWKFKYKIKGSIISGSFVCEYNIENGNYYMKSYTEGLLSNYPLRSLQ